ncbi:MAG: amidohydrolase family protein [Kibdelosporangium sp.]
MSAIDIHHHAMVAGYVERLTAIGVSAQPGVAFPEWSVGDSLALMDRLDIEMAVLSVGSPGFYFGDQAFTDELCRDTNDELAVLVRQRPDRFAAFAVLPLPSVDSTLEELDRIESRQEFVGIGMLTNYGEQYLGAEQFDPVLARLNAMQAVVHVHPTLPVTWPKQQIDLRPSLLEYVFDTTRALTNLMLRGVPHRFPRIQWIFSHCGGVAPFIAGRLAIAEPLPELAQVRADGVLATMAGFHYDTALSTTPMGLGSLLGLVGRSQIVLGSDFPFVDEQTVTRCRRELDDLLPDLDPVLTENARRLLPRLWSGTKS